MLDEEAAKTAVRIGDNDNLRAIEVTYRYRIDDVDASSPLVRSSVVLPLRADGATIGSLSVFCALLCAPGTPTQSSPSWSASPRRPARRSRTPGAMPRPARSSTSIRLTGLHNRRYFHEMLAREIARAGRYERRLDGVVFDLDDFSADRRPHRHAAGDVVLAGSRSGSSRCPRGRRHLPPRRRRVRGAAAGIDRRGGRAARRADLPRGRRAPGRRRRHALALGGRGGASARRRAERPLPACRRRGPPHERNGVRHPAPQRDNSNAPATMPDTRRLENGPPPCFEKVSDTCSPSTRSRRESAVSDTAQPAKTRGRFPRLRRAQLPVWVSRRAGCRPRGSPWPRRRRATRSRPSPVRHRSSGRARQSRRNPRPGRSPRAPAGACPARRPRGRSARSARSRCSGTASGPWPPGSASR